MEARIPHFWFHWYLDTMAVVFLTQMFVASHQHYSYSYGSRDGHRTLGKYNALGIANRWWVTLNESHCLPELRDEFPFIKKGHVQCVCLRDHVSIKLHVGDLPSEHQRMTKIHFRCGANRTLQQLVWPRIHDMVAFETPTMVENIDKGLLQHPKCDVFNSHVKPNPSAWDFPPCRAMEWWHCAIATDLWPMVWSTERHVQQNVAWAVENCTLANCNPWIATREASFDSRILCVWCFWISLQVGPYISHGRCIGKCHGNVVENCFKQLQFWFAIHSSKVEMTWGLPKKMCSCAMIWWLHNPNMVSNICVVFMWRVASIQQKPRKDWLTSFALPIAYGGGHFIHCIEIVGALLRFILVLPLMVRLQDAQLWFVIGSHSMWHNVDYGENLLGRWPMLAEWVAKTVQIVERWLDLDVAWTVTNVGRMRTEWRGALRLPEWRERA